MSTWIHLLLLLLPIVSGTYQEATPEQKNAAVWIVIGCICGGMAISASVAVGIFMMNRRNADQVLVLRIPGGTERWARAADKSFAMEVCLTRNQASGQEAEDRGIVSKVFPVDQVVGEAVKLGEKVADQ
ncbi:hypothetical protein L5515_010222 [Caenorhabditis briggsae]|uniref:Uncharacterized protein n=1 Tax=Caenorhabditis briggsae TaxID=6238 RepID=A0AAE9JDV1_CAEBR|nr:hypothetical protein L5515_010222 [Caenorhabditis briggsae]